MQRDGSLVLLILDPSHSPQQMAQFGSTSRSDTALWLLRRNESAMKAKQYQIVAVTGTIDTEQQYQVRKFLFRYGTVKLINFLFVLLLLLAK